MSAPPVGRRPLVGRADDLARLQALAEAVRDGRGGALRVDGTPGIGKTALLAAVDPCELPVLAATGVETETGLALAGLEELLAGLGDDADHPSALAPGQDPAALLRAIAARLAAAAPLLVLVDDAQWLDPSSRAAVAFLARRAQRLGIGVIAVWSLRGEAPDEWPGVPVLALEALERPAALQLAADGGLAPPVAEALVGAVGGNALALVEAPASLTADQRAGRAVLPDPLPVGDRLQRAYTARLAGLDAPVRDALLLAAAGAPASLVADRLGPAEDARLVRLGASDGRASAGVAFTHPLVRSAIYHAAEPSARRAAHRTIAAQAPDPGRTWQLALAAPGPDEALAARLVELGEQARDLGAPGTAAAMLERAARLTPDPEPAAARTLAAAATATVAGRPALATALLDALLPTVRDPAGRADVQLLRGMALHQTGRPREAHALLQAEAERIEPTDPLRACALLTQACVALMGPGPMAQLSALAGRARALAPPGADIIPAVIEAETLVSLGEHARARELLGRHEPALRQWDPTAPGHEVLAVAGLCRLWLGDHDVAETILTRLVDANRLAGAAGPLALPLAVLATLHIRRGDLPRAADCADEALEIAETGLGGGFVLTLALAAVAMTAAHRGDAGSTRRSAERMLALGAELELPSTLACAEQALGHSRLGRGDAATAATHLRSALEHTRHHGTLDPAFLFTHADLVEALVRSGRAADAEPVLAELEAGAALTGGSWAAAAVERCRALLGPDDALDAHLAAALARHADPSMPFEAARTRLVIGERLRRARRRADAREQLRLARDAFQRAGAKDWSDRAERELAATGGSDTGTDELTARERDVCDLVAGGATNREVAEALFLSPRTVEHHLRTAYRKLGVRSRTELAARRNGRA